MKKKQFSPDANPPVGETPSPKKKSTTPNIPTKDADIDTLAQAVNEKWKSEKDYKLKWITQSTFEIMADSYSENLAQRTLVGGDKPSQTKTLKQTNDQIDEAVKEVMVYIQKKFKKANAVAQYARYGIIKENRAYCLPRDNDNRKKNLPLMGKAIAADGFDAEEFGTAFWTGVSTDFKNALKATSDTSKTVSNKVAAKDADKESIHKVLIAITHLIYANEPDNSDAVMREWGYLKQNY